MTSNDLDDLKGAFIGFIIVVIVILLAYQAESSPNNMPGTPQQDCNYSIEC